MVGVAFDEIAVLLLSGAVVDGAGVRSVNGPHLFGHAGLIDGLSRLRSVKMIGHTATTVDFAVRADYRNNSRHSRLHLLNTMT